MKQRSLITMVVIAAGLAVLGLVLLWPSGSQGPTRVSALVSAQLEMDFNITNGTGPCDPHIDGPLRCSSGRTCMSRCVPRTMPTPRLAAR